MLIGDMIEASPTAAVISDPRLPDNPIVVCNDAFVRLTGYAREEVVGQNCRFLHGPETEPWLSEQLREGIREQRPVLVEILNYRKDGTPFRNAVMVAPIFDAAGEIEYFLGSQIEVQPQDAAPGGPRQASAKEKIERLSPRQREVLVLMSAGKRNKQIAWELGLAERTVKMHRAAVMRSLEVRTSADAIRLAVESGL